MQNQFKLKFSNIFLIRIRLLQDSKLIRRDRESRSGDSSGREYSGSKNCRADPIEGRNCGGVHRYCSTPDSNTKSDPPFSSSLSSNLATRLPNRTEKIHLAFSRSMSLPLTMADSGFSPSQGECRRKENRDF
ncbi:hypothetical protein FF1_031106 [Malus domestica]